MTFCGYNSKIGMGIKMLAEGMADAISEKAQALDDNGIANSNILSLQNELFELEVMAKVMNEGGELAKIFMRLNDFAKEIFSIVLSEVKRNPTTDFALLTKLIGGQLDILVRDTEQFRVTIDDTPTLLFNETLVVAVGQWVNKNSPSYFDEAVQLKLF